MLTTLSDHGASPDVGWTKTKLSPDAARSARTRNGSHKNRSWRGLDSSEIEASGDDSVYAASRAHSSAYTDTSSDKENTPNAVSVLDAHQRRKIKRRESNKKQIVHFINKPQGTPLFTIAEQKSLGTLRSKASGVAFYVRPTRQTQCHKVNSNITTPAESDRAGRAASADDVLLFANPRSGAHDSSTESGAQYDHAEVLTIPHQPPFSPPSRIKTPEGFPRWPGDNHPSSNLPRRQLLATNRARSLALSVFKDKARLRSVVSGYFRGRSRIPQRNPQRRWRPPTSGHSTAGFTFSSHPFHHLQAHPVATGQALPGIPRQLEVSLNRRSRTRSRSGAPSAGRALGAISGNAIPINAARILSASGPRSVPLPDDFIQRGVDTAVSPRKPDVTPGLDQPFTSNTMRTIDLIESFPQPPTNPPTSPLRSDQDLPRLFAPSPCKPRPVSFVQGGLAVVPHPDHTDEHVDRSGDELHERGVASKKDSVVGLVPVCCRGPIATQVEDQGERCSGDMGRSNTPPIRGEANARYSLTGTPIYRSDTASVISHDRQQLRRVAENESLANTNSGSADNEPMVTCGVSMQDQAPMSASSPTHAYLQAVSGATAPAAGPESNSTVLSTVTSLGKLCPHLLARVLAESEPPMAMDGNFVDAQGTSIICGQSRLRQLWKQLMQRKRASAETKISQGKTQCWKCKIKQCLKHIRL